VLVEDAFPAAGAVVDEQLFRAGGAGEAADGVPGQAERGSGLAEVAALGQQPVHVGVPGAGPVRDPPVPGCGGHQGRGRRHPGCGRRGLRCGRCRQVLAVTADCPLDGLAKVVPQMPAVGDLDSVRCAPAAAIGVDTGPVPADQFGSRPGGEPPGERVRRAVIEDVDRPAGLDIN